jgi:N-acetylmuramoyl-L-alanine amidase
MKLCIDPGHGMANRRPGLFDPGCERDEITEADLVLSWALELEAQCTKLGVPTFMTRRDATTPALLRDRVKRATAEGCTHILSLHVNDADSPKANGTETLYRKASSLVFAKLVQMLAVQHLGLKDRGVKARGDLAILNHPQAALLELGFIGSSSDLATIECRCCRISLCRAIAQALAASA